MSLQLITSYSGQISVGGDAEDHWGPAPQHNRPRVHTQPRTHTFSHTHESMKSHSCIHTAEHAHTTCVQSQKHTCRHTRMCETTQVRAHGASPQGCLRKPAGYHHCLLPPSQWAEVPPTEQELPLCRVKNRPLLYHDFTSLEWSCLHFPKEYSECQDHSWDL